MPENIDFDAEDDASAERAAGGWRVSEAMQRDSDWKRKSLLKVGDGFSGFKDERERCEEEFDLGFWWGFGCG